MAIILDKNKDKDTATSQMPTSTGTTSTPGMMQTPTTPPKGSGGRFANVKQYMGANVGAGQQMARQLGATGQQLAQTVGSRVGQSQQQFQQHAQNVREGIQKGMAGGIEAFGTAGQETQQTTPSTQQQQFQSLYSGNVAQQAGQLGPDTTALQAQTEALNRQAERAKQGRFDLLKDKFGAQGSRYTSGQQALDEAILQSSLEGGQLAKQLTEQASGVEEKLSGLQNLIGKESTALGKEAETAKNQLQELFKTGEITTGAGPDGIIGTADDIKQSYGEGIEDIAKTLSERAETQSAEQKANYDQILGLFQKVSDGDITATEMNQLGKLLGVNTKEGLYGIDVNKYLANPETITELGAGQVATDAEKKRYEALAKLAGEGAISEEDIVRFEDQVTPQTIFDKEKFAKDVASGKEKFYQNEELQNAYKSSKDIDKWLGKSNYGLNINNNTNPNSLVEGVYNILKGSGFSDKEFISIIKPVLQELHGDQSGRTKSNIVKNALETAKKYKLGIIDTAAQESGAYTTVSGSKTNLKDILKGFK